METSKTINITTPLHGAATKVLAAAMEYWEIYQRELGSGAVVYLEDDVGHLLVFTRMEHYATLMQNIPRCRRDAYYFGNRTFGDAGPKNEGAETERIREALDRSRHVAQTCEDSLCIRDHIDLARWLEELLDYKRKGAE